MPVEAASPQELRQRLRQYEMLSEISSAVRMAKSPDEISRLLVEQVGQLFGAASAGLTTPTMLHYAYGGWASLTGQSILSESALEILMAGSTSESYFDVDLVHGPLSAKPQWSAGLNSLIGAPIVVDQNLSRVLWLGGVAPFSAEQKQQLAAAAEMAANALQRAAAFERERRLRAVAEALADVATAVSQTMELEVVLPHILDRAAHAVECAGGVLLIKEGERMRALGRLGLPAGEVEARLPAVLQPLLIADTSADSHWPGSGAVRSMVVAPIRIEAEALGVLALYGERPQAFELQALKHAQSFAAYAAMAIRNARLQADLQIQLAREQKDRQRILQSERLATLGELVAGVAHELNNPLTTILLYASQLLQEGAQSPTLLTDLQTIAAEAQRSAKLVRSLLEFARQRTPEQKPVHVEHVLLGALDILAYELRAHNIHVVTAIEPNLPLTLADPYQLQQVFTNLINNAWQAMSQAYGSGTLTVRVETAAGSQSDQVILRITIRDTGPGIPPSALPDIFTPFFTTKESGKGTGLGLSVAYGIVAQHHGQIWAETSLPHGAVFTVELPVIAPAALAPEVIPAPEVGQPQPLGPARILLVDDEVNLAEVMARVLRNGGYQVTVAHTGLEGLESVRATRFDFLISDIRMPELSGPEFYRQVCAYAPDLASQMIFITGDTVSLETRQFLSETGVAYLSKPFEMAELLRRITQNLSNRASNRQAPREATHQSISRP